MVRAAVSLALHVRRTGEGTDYMDYVPLRAPVKLNE
jgi:hypothetical protein